MGMCKQMILTILLVTRTLRTVSELQVRIILIRSATYYTLMTYILSLCRAHLLVVISPSLHLFRSKSSEILCTQIEYHKAHQRHGNINSSHKCLLSEIIHCHEYIYYRQILHLDRNDHGIQDTHIRITKCNS